VNSNRLLRTLEGHVDSILSLAFDPTGRTLASGSADGTIKLWDISTLLKADANSDRLRRDDWLLRAQESIHWWCDLPAPLEAEGLLRTLEWHTSAVDEVDYSPDGRLMGSKSKDHTVRLWRVDTFEPVAVIAEPTSHEQWTTPGLAFHPLLPLLATVGSDPDTPKDDRDRIIHMRDRLIHIWELDLAVLFSQTVTPTVNYTSAKVVLVGESNVGKSFLAHRITTGSPPEEGTIKPTHGMKFWLLAPEQLCLTAKPPQGQRREVVLWDMGGQEEYRLIHQLFLHDTAVALVLLNPTRGAPAFKEVETWNKYLEKQLSGRAAIKLLVGAKVDQPTATIDRQALERLRIECGFDGYYETSAITGLGIAEFCEAVASAINWNGLGLTSRPGTISAHPRRNRGPPQTR